MIHDYVRRFILFFLRCILCGYYIVLFFYYFRRLIEIYNFCLIDQLLEILRVYNVISGVYLRCVGLLVWCLKVG